ncbi:MAG TPA: hypothetical protein PKH24_08100 [Sedimentisphaerales bacterium]|jgi:hypothetical protein|nr:hypothetical protein [Sedimentisphaerales bacterium]HNU28941.1 hypothetical protein [Sedimentisphaerales bacterium]
MALLLRKMRFALLGLVTMAIVAGAFVWPGIYRGAMTLHDLLTENKQLRQAIANLTAEDQIGYAKVISQRRENGRLLTTIRFVETARNDKTKVILQKEYTIEGDVVHFDAVIVKFDDKMVSDGTSRALYLWRRVYGEKMPPDDGFPIEEPGAEPRRYSGLLEALPIPHRQLFWSSIWELANDPEKLHEYGIRAIYGNAVYQPLKEGLIYVFKISPTGQFYPEAVPDM